MTTRFSDNAAQFGDSIQPDAAATDLVPAPYTAALVKRRFDVDFDVVRSPSSTFVPEYYEPNYAYPLLIWLHDEGGSERDLLRLMPEISNRNYFGFSLRGPLESRTGDTGYRWSQFIDDAIDVESELHEQVGRLRRMYNIHSERVFIGGCGNGATTALLLGLRRPEWFAGVACLGGRLPAINKLLANYRHLQGKRVLLAPGNGSDLADRKQTRDLGALLHTAGMTVCSRNYDATRPMHNDLLRDIDRWMMQECYRTVSVE